MALSLKVIGNKMVNQYRREYILILKDMHGARHSVTAVRLGSIAEVKRAPNVKLFRRVFPNSKHDIIRAFDRPHNNVDMR